DALRGLRSLGFRESEVRAALERLRADASMTTATLDQVLRAALSALTPPVRRAPQSIHAVSTDIGVESESAFSAWSTHTTLPPATDRNSSPLTPLTIVDSVPPAFGKRPMTSDPK